MVVNAGVRDCVAGVDDGGDMDRSVDLPPPILSIVRDREVGLAMGFRGGMIWVCKGVLVQGVGGVLLVIA